MRIRFAVAALAAGLAALPSVSPARTRSPATTAAPPVVVDVTRLRLLGLGPVAELVGQTLSGELGGLAVAPGNRVVVRLVGLSLNAYAGSDGGGGGGGDAGGSGMGSGTNYDYLEGEILLLGNRGEVLRSFPQVLALPASSGGAYYTPGAEQRRVRNLSTNFASWIRRRLG